MFLIHSGQCAGDDITVREVEHGSGLVKFHVNFGYTTTVTLTRAELVALGELITHALGEGSE